MCYVVPINGVVQLKIESIDMVAVTYSYMPKPKYLGILSQQSSRLAQYNNVEALNLLRKKGRYLRCVWKK